MCKISVCGSLVHFTCIPIRILSQDTVGALVHDLCSRIFWPTLSGSYKTTCARSLYQDPLGPLLSGSCRTTSARSLSQDLCVRVLLNHLHLCLRILLNHLYQDPLGPLLVLCIKILLDRLCQDPLGPLVQDLSMRILLDHCIGILLDHCLRILWDNFCKIFVSGSLCEDPLAQDRIRTSTTSVFCETSSKTANPELQTYARLPPKLKIRTSKTSVLCETSSKTKDPNFQNERFLRDFHENGNMFRKYCACHEIMTRGHTKCCTGHANCSSSSSFKNVTLLRNRALRPQNIASMVRIPCACHVKRNPSNDTRLPTFWQRPQNTAPATIFTTCPIPCTCHVNSRFHPPKPSDLLHLSRKTTFCSKRYTDTR